MIFFDKTSYIFRVKVSKNKDKKRTIYFFIYFH